MLFYYWTQRTEFDRFGLFSDAIVPSVNVGNFFFKVTPCLKKCLISNQSSCIKLAVQILQISVLKFWWIYKKQYQTIVELIRGTVSSHSFAAAILILFDREQRDKYFQCGRCIMPWYIFRGRRQKLYLFKNYTLKQNNTTSWCVIIFKNIFPSIALWKW